VFGYFNLSYWLVRKNRKKFAFCESEDLIYYCLILFMMALALADNAFKNKFTSLKQIYDLIVLSNTDRIRLRWDEEWAKRPIFCDVEHTPKGVRISKTKALQYTKH
jgi:hypothetical protein